MIIGAGACGLSSALLLAADGHEVTVLERDPAPPPSPAEAAWDGWSRRGVNQFRMIHLLAPRWRHLVEQELPEVATSLEGAGGFRANPLKAAPEQLTGGWRDGDERFEVLTARRPVVEAVVAGVAARTPGIEVRRGAAVQGLRTGPAGPNRCPHVIGVRTDAGDDIEADLVVDAAGRRSRLGALLADVGAPPIGDEVEDSGFVYYARHFRSADGSMPPMIGGVLQHYESLTTLTLPADNGTWGVGLILSAGDAPLRALSDVDTWMRVVRSYPLVAHWVEGEPIDEQPAVMAKLEDRHRRFVVDGAPVATGVVAVGDSWACTNPSLGRGISMGLLHAQALRDQLRTTPLDDHQGFARAWDETTSAVVGPWYRDTLSFDRHRLAEMKAQTAGTAYRPDDPWWTQARSMERAAFVDADVLRAYLSVVTVFETTDQVLADPRVLAKALAKGAGWQDAAAPGPARPELLSIAAA